jgi:transposase InsO family protein
MYLIGTLRRKAPNQKWTADFSYFWTVQRWLYLAVVLDFFSRCIVGMVHEGGDGHTDGERCSDDGNLATGPSSSHA